MHKPHFWLRDETKLGEKRTPLVPSDAGKLLGLGFKVTVESSENRIFSDDEYRAFGCDIAPSQSWLSAPSDCVILGLKELPSEISLIKHRHIYFAHAYKDQKGWESLLCKFKQGNGALFDLEFLKDKTGKRVAAFGYWAGFVGACLAVEQWLQQESGEKLNRAPVYSTKTDWIEDLKGKLTQHAKSPKVMIIGALGRCGQGAISSLDSLGVQVTTWDKKETDQGGPFDEILAHDIFLNCVFIDQPCPPFITKDMLTKGMQLNLVCDISCDPLGEYNPVPLYNECTTTENPVALIKAGETSLNLIAIDNLPSLLPKESSNEYSNQLIGVLTKFPHDDAWLGALDLFYKKTSLLSLVT